MAKNSDDIKMKIIKDLWLKRRDLVSDGYDESLNYLAKIIPLKINKIPTGIKCWTWIVPEKWSVGEAYIEEIGGRRLLDLKNHPLHIIHSGSANTHIYPLNEIKKKHPRMPVEVYEDKMDYDLSVFMMLPFVGGSLGEAWKRYPIPEGFIPINGEKSEASLIYLDRGASLHQQDSLTVSHVMPSYVLRHLGDWMQDGRNIISHEKTFGQKLEGRVSVPLDVGKKIFGEITSNLESRYKTKLSFKRD